MGTVDQVVDNYREHILDGFVIDDRGDGLRFVDAPEVGAHRRTRRDPDHRPEAVASCRRRRAAPGTFSANVRSGQLGKLFGRAWKRD